MRSRPEIDWTTPEAYLPGIEPPPRRERLTSRITLAVATFAAHLERRRLLRVQWATAARGSPEDLPERLRKDIGLPPEPGWRDYSRFL